MFNPFKMFLPKKMIGVDIGTSSIKIVEISHWGGGKTLENYGEIKAMSLYEEQDPFRSFAGSNYLLSDFFVSRAIKAVLDESGIKTKAAVFSIPDYSTFSTSFELPPMLEREIAEAVKYHAPAYIPLPISETTLDWQLINGIPGDKKSKLEILLTAIPNQIVQSYKKVAESCGLELYSIEAEALAITRALTGSAKKTVCVIDIGVQSTTINMVDSGHLKKSYSSSFAGGQLNYAIASSFGLSRIEAEEIKNQKGLLYVDENFAKALYLLIDPLLFEVKKISSDFLQTTGKNIEEIYLTGGTANLPGLKEYFQESLDKKVFIPNCFSEFLYPPILDETLKEMAPSFSVAAGVALGGLEG